MDAAIATGERARYESYLTDPAEEPNPAKWGTEVAIRLADRQASRWPALSDSGRRGEPADAAGSHRVGPSSRPPWFSTPRPFRRGRPRSIVVQSPRTERV